MQSNQDLLAEIFGSSSTPSAPSPAAPAQSQKSTVQDILGLFDSPAAPSTSTPVQTQAPVLPVSNGGASAFSLPQAQTPPPQPAQPAQPRLTAYPAYDKNELRITLTPQVPKPGVVNILARFQVTGNTPATGLNFQAAVPKVGNLVVSVQLKH